MKWLSLTLGRRPHLIWLRWGLMCGWTALLVFGIQAQNAPLLTDFDAALTQAKQANKLVFIIYGRDTCHNCQALKGYINSNELDLPAQQFVCVFLNCDDPADQTAFRSHYTVTGATLPFVVIAAPGGSMLVSRTGFGATADFQTLIANAVALWIPAVVTLKLNAQAVSNHLEVSARLAPGSAALPPSFAYQVQASSDLVNWTTVTNGTSLATPAVWVETSLAHGSSRFFRIVSR